MKTMSMLTALSFGLAIAGVSTAQAQSVNSAQYNQDNYECQQYANQVSPVGDAAVGALGGAATGAALGAIIGASAHGVSVGQGAAYGAAAGGVLGLGGGAITGVQNQRQVYRNCMAGRGYSILN